MAAVLLLLPEGRRTRNSGLMARTSFGFALSSSLGGTDERTCGPPPPWPKVQVITARPSSSLAGTGTIGGTPPPPWVPPFSFVGCEDVTAVV